MYKILLLAALFVAVQADGKAKYKLELEVHDHHSGGVQTRKEERNGDSTKGEYTITEKDGSKTKVQYSVYGHHHGHHEEEHHGHHYIETQSGHGSSGKQEQGYHSSEGHGSSISSSGLGTGSSHEFAGYQFGKGLHSSDSKSNGYESSESGQSGGYQFGHGLLGGSKGHHSSSFGYSGGSGSFASDSKHGYESEKSFQAHKEVLGSSGYKHAPELSSYHFGGFGSGKSSLGYLSGHSSGAFQKTHGHYSGDSSESDSSEYKYGHGSEQKSLHYSGSSGSESESKYGGKQQEAYSSSSFQAGHEAKLSGSSPSFSGYTEQDKHKVSYKPLYYKPQLYHQTQSSHLLKPKYEQNFYKTESQGKYQTESKSGAQELSHASGGYKDSGEAKSYHNFITFESGKGGKYHHKPSYHHQSSEQDSYHKTSGSNEGSSFYHTSKGEGYKATSGESSGSYGGYQYKSKYPAPIPVKEEQDHYKSVGGSGSNEGSSFYHTSKGEGYKAASEESKGSYGSYQYKSKYPAPIPVKAEEGHYKSDGGSSGKGIFYHYQTGKNEGSQSEGSLGNYESYKFNSKYPALKPIHEPAVHEERQFESSAYSSGKGGYHYYGGSESNDGHKTGYSSFELFPAISHGSTKEEYGSSLGDFSKLQGGYNLYHEEDSSSEGFGDEGSYKGEYGSSLASFGKLHGGYSSSHGGGFGFSEEGYGSFKGGYGSSEGGLGKFHGYSSSQGDHSSSKEGFDSALGGFGKLQEGYSKGDSHSSSKEGVLKYHASSEGSSNEAYSSGYSSGGEATSRVKLHTHGADVETLTKHIIPPKYHEGKQ